MYRIKNHYLNKPFFRIGGEDSAYPYISNSIIAVLANIAQSKKIKITKKAMKEGRKHPYNIEKFVTRRSTMKIFDLTLSAPKQEVTKRVFTSIEDFPFVWKVTAGNTTHMFDANLVGWVLYRCKERNLQWWVKDTTTAPTLYIMDETGLSIAVIAGIKS